MAEDFEKWLAGEQRAARRAQPLTVKKECATRGLFHRGYLHRRIAKLIGCSEVYVRKLDWMGSSKRRTEISTNVEALLSRAAELEGKMDDELRRFAQEMKRT